MTPLRQPIARCLRLLATLVAFASAGSAAAQPDLTQNAPNAVDAAGVNAPAAAEQPGETSAAEVTAAEVTGAPRPGDESGRIDGGERDSVMRRIGRGALAIPRGAFELAFTPVRAGVWVFDRYHLAERAHRLFFTDDGTIGLYPTAKLESGAGVTAGARFVANRNDDRQRARIDVGAGGRYRRIVAGRLHGLYLDDRLSAELRVDHDVRPRERFYGIGNGDEVSPTTLAAGTMIDARVDDTAVATRFRQRIERATLALDVRAVDQLHVRAAGTYSYLTLSPSDTGPPISDIYLMDSLVGFHGVQQMYGELELAWDSRGPARRWDSSALYSTGWLVSAFAGRAAVTRHPDHWRYGGDIQRFIRLATGPRVLALRLHGEAVTGGRGEVPLFDLPALGGSSMLRGYPVERFRDRVATFGTVEYEWDLARTVFASVFVDAGRVFPSIDQIGQLGIDDVRCGYGVALEVHGNNSFLGRASLASSIDGGVFVDLSFDPIFDVSPRVVRR
jgi:hypothetical protein